MQLEALLLEEPPPWQQREKQASCSTPFSRTEFDYLWNVMGLRSFYIERLNGLAKNRYIKCELDDKLRDLHGINE